MKQVGRNQAGPSDFNLPCPEMLLATCIAILFSIISLDFQPALP